MLYKLNQIFQLCFDLFLFHKFHHHHHHPFYATVDRTILNKNEIIFAYVTFNSTMGLVNVWVKICFYFVSLWYRDRIDEIVRSVQKTFIKSARKHFTQIILLFELAKVFFFIIIFSFCFILHLSYRFFPSSCSLPIFPLHFYSPEPSLFRKERSIVMIEYKYLPGCPHPYPQPPHNY